MGQRLKNQNHSGQQPGIPAELPSVTTPDTSRAPAFPPADWPIGETRVVPSHHPDLSDNHITRTGEFSYTGFNAYQPQQRAPIRRPGMKFVEAIAADDPRTNEEILGSYCRSIAEISPIEDTAVLDQYPDCLPRTPIDPPSTVRSPGLMRGNADLKPSTWNPPQYRDCQTCMGKGTGRALIGGGNAACAECKGFGRIRL